MFEFDSCKLKPLKRGVFLLLNVFQQFTPNQTLNQNQND